MGSGVYIEGYFGKFVFAGGTIYGANANGTAANENSNTCDPSRGASLHISVSADNNKIIWGNGGSYGIVGSDVGGANAISVLTAGGGRILNSQTGATYNTGTQVTTNGNVNVLTKNTLQAVQ
jgi:hypothetical protein